MAENDWEVRVELDATPLTRQDYAYPQVALAFGFNDEMIEALVGTDTHRYWAALTEATAACVIEGPNREITVPGIDIVRSLHDTANQNRTNAEAHTFLDSFANHALLLRQRLGTSMSKFVDADSFYAAALEAFTTTNNPNLTRNERKHLASYHYREQKAWDSILERLRPGFEFALRSDEVEEELGEL